MRKNLASKIPNTSFLFEYFINQSDFVMETKALSMNELKNAFYSLKSDRNSGYDNISYNVVKNFFNSLYEPLKYLISKLKRVFFQKT